MALADRILYMGSRDRAKQVQLGIPGGKASGQPGVLVLDSGAATPTQYKLFAGTTGTLRITSGTAFGDGDGTPVGSGASGANTALSNLASVAINVSLVSDAANTDDLGSDTYPWKSLYVRTSLIFDKTTRNLTITASEPGTSARTVNFGDPGADDSVAYLAATQALTNKTYEGLTLAGATNAISITQGTASIVLAAGDTDIALGAGAQVDVAAAKVVDIDMNLTVNTANVTLNQSLSTTDNPTFGNLTVTQITDGAATLTGGALTGITTFSAADITATNSLNVAGDTKYLTLGTAGSTDSRVYFNGTSLCFWDSEVNTVYTLQQIATGTALNPSVTGDLAIPDGKLTWTNFANEAAGVWTFANTTAIDIAQISAISTGTAYSITADACANGKLLVLDADGDVGATGYYVYCLDGTNPMFTVGPKGATIIAGNAALTDALTVTAGDLVVTNGEFTVASTADTVNKISRNNATGTAAVLEIEETHATGGVTLLIDSNATDGNHALKVEHDGTGSGLHITGTAVTGSQASFIGPASQTASSVIVDGTTGSWIGAANVGMLHLSSDGALANANASLIYSTYTGAVGAVQVTGTCAKLVDAGAAGTNTWALGITSTNNSGAIITTSAVGMSALKLVGPAAQTASMLVLDGTATTGWGGAATTGMLHIALDGATLNATASAIQVVIGTGTPTDTATGYVLKISDTTTAPATPQSTYAIHASTTSNAMYLTTTNVATTALTLSGPEAQTAAILSVDASTGTGWDGAANVGAVSITGDGTHIHANASLLYIGHSGTGLASNLGSSLRINDSSTAAAGAYVAYLTSTNNSLMGLTTVAVGKSSLVITGPASQTASQVTIGSAALGWIGAASTGMLQLDSNGAMVADASLLRVTSATQPAVANDGVCAEFIETGTAQATSYAVRIASTNNEALHVDAGLAVFDEGPLVQYSASAATDTAPTITELNTAFGITAAAGYNGFVGVLYDSTGAFGGYLCWIANGVWYYEQGAVAGA